MRSVESFADSAEMYMENLWIVVGESVLHGARSLSCKCREVALPSDLVHHSGVAVATLLGYTSVFAISA